MHRLKGKVAIVTGSSSGIGKAIALTFAAEGARVVVAARRLALCEQVVAQITEHGGEALAIRTDVMEELQVEHLIAETVRQLGRLDILVNNAGIGGGGLLPMPRPTPSIALSAPTCAGPFSAVGPDSGR